MIILHRKCDRIVRSSRPVIAESLYHGVFFCLPLFGKKVAELCCTNVCKTDKNSEKHLSNFSKYSIHLKHSKHPFVQKIALYRTKMTANLQNENGPQRGPFYFSLNSVEAHFEPPARNSQCPPRAFRAPHETANAPPPRILRLRRVRCSGAHPPQKKRTAKGTPAQGYQPNTVHEQKARTPKIRRPRFAFWCARHGQQLGGERPLRARQ